MRYFVVPFDMESEDKVIGGYISLRQFLWLIIPVISLIAMFIVNKNYIIRTESKLAISAINIAWRLVLDLALLINSIVMAFVKIKGENSDVYVVSRIKYAFKAHTYI
ncbi:PrgI family mobile element protein [Clostridium oryzae]|uniref:PrgI family protein n=1 Tax=Clostridium oryzae TaxID=1450648 RepID=A0A1V4IID0_9CLOT|nr:PrgI family protein [Clostridium oryzae]OPJ59761.1 PrgI family protein [Clostridium oryzae]